MGESLERVFSPTGPREIVRGRSKSLDIPIKANECADAALDTGARASIL
jgi:hypothetical protein